jgi:hypothetical protein
MVPGSTYYYSNNNQLFLSYFIEKLSGMKLQLYFSKHIFVPLGMTDTFLDSLNGELSVQKSFVSAYWDYSNLQITPDGTPFAHGKITVTESNQGTLSGSGGVVSTIWDMARFYSSVFLANNVTLIKRIHIDEMIMSTGITGDFSSDIGTCRTWGLGMFLFFNTCIDSKTQKASCSACLPGTGNDYTWTEKDRVIAYYEGVVKAFTFTISYGENWTHPDGARFVSVAGRNNIVIDTNQDLYDTATLSVVGTIDQVTKGWPQYGLTIFTSLTNLITGYSGGYATAHAASSESNDLDTGTLVGVIFAVFIGFILVFGFWKWARGDCQTMKPHEKDISNDTSNRMHTTL